MGAPFEAPSSKKFSPQLRQYLDLGVISLRRTSGWSPAYRDIVRSLALFAPAICDRLCESGSGQDVAEDMAARSAKEEPSCYGDQRNNCYHDEKKRRWFVPLT